MLNEPAYTTFILILKGYSMYIFVLHQWSLLTCLSWAPIGLNQTIKLVFVAFRLSTLH